MSTHLFLNLLCTTTSSSFKCLDCNTVVLSEAPHGGEAPAAVGAAEWFLSCVNKLMSLQVVVLTESPPAQAALKRFLSAVDPFVSNEVL